MLVREPGQAYAETMRTTLAFVLVAVGLVAAVGAAGRPSAGPRTFGTRGPVQRIAADGTHVAVLAARGVKRCGAVVVFDAAT